MNEIDQKYENFFSKSFVKFVEMTMTPKFPSKAWVTEKVSVNCSHRLHFKPKQGLVYWVNLSK